MLKQDFKVMSILEVGNFMLKSQTTPQSLPTTALHSLETHASPFTVKLPHIFIS